MATRSAKQHQPRSWSHFKCKIQCCPCYAQGPGGGSPTHSPDTPPGGPSDPLLEGHFFGISRGRSKISDLPAWPQHRSLQPPLIPPLAWIFKIYAPQGYPNTHFCFIGIQSSGQLRLWRLTNWFVPRRQTERFFSRQFRNILKT